MASRLHLTEKTAQGTKQGAKLPEIPTQGREIGVFLAFSRFPASITRIEQDLRRRMLYPTELRGQMDVFCYYFGKIRTFYRIFRFWESDEMPPAGWAAFHSNDEH